MFTKFVRTMIPVFSLRSTTSNQGHTTPLWPIITHQARQEVKHQESNKDQEMRKNMRRAGWETTINLGWWTQRRYWGCNHWTNAWACHLVRMWGKPIEWMRGYRWIRTWILGTRDKHLCHAKMPNVLTEILSAAPYNGPHLEQFEVVQAQYMDELTM